MTKEVYACEPLRVWNRLEARPRTRDFGRALKAEVFDPLWLLTRQWQFGELKGEEAGSAITVSMATRTSPIVGVVTPPAAGATAPIRSSYDIDREPLERLIEQTPPVLDVATRARLGEMALAAVAAAAARQALPFDRVRNRAALAAAFPIARVAPPTDAAERMLFDADRAASPTRDRMERSLAGRGIDGVSLVAALPAGGVTVATLPVTIAGAIETGLRAAYADGLERHRAWSAATLGGVGVVANSSWDPQRLEHTAACLVRRHGEEWVLTADAYAGGTLDWYSFDLAGTAAAPVAAGPDVTETAVFTAIARPVEFPGMPRARYWELEDSAVDIGNAPADPTDLAKTVIAEFCLLYGNNWLVAPCTVRPGTLVEVDAVIVTDVFGQRTLVSASNQSALDWSSWDFFSLARQSIAGTAALGAHLFVPPKPPRVLESDSIEEVTFTRDEGANLVWAIERTIPDGIGGGRSGVVYGQTLRAELARRAPAPQRSAIAGAFDYRVISTFPEHWIPFVPAHLPGTTAAVRLQRASMPRTIGDRVVPVRPRAEMLRDGITGLVQQRPYYIREEEVPRHGLEVARTYQRARWADGRTCLWFGNRRGAGRGEGTSGLAFDIAYDPNRA